MSESGSPFRQKIIVRQSQATQGNQTAFSRTVSLLHYNIKQLRFENEYLMKVETTHAVPVQEATPIQHKYNTIQISKQMITNPCHRNQHKGNALISSTNIGG